MNVVQAVEELEDLLEFCTAKGLEAMTISVRIAVVRVVLVPAVSTVCEKADSPGVDDVSCGVGAAE